MEIGIDSFAARFDDAGLAASPVDRMRELLERIEHADQVGLDVFGVGEHHKRVPGLCAAGDPGCRGSSHAKRSSDQRGGRFDLTTFGRETGRLSDRAIWITTDAWGRIHIRSGQGLSRDWPRNLFVTFESVGKPARTARLIEPVTLDGGRTVAV